MLVIGAEWQLGIFNSTSPFTKFQTLTPVSTAPSTRLPRSSIHMMDSSPPCKYQWSVSVVLQQASLCAACKYLVLHAHAQRQLARSSTVLPMDATRPEPYTTVHICN